MIDSNYYIMIIPATPGNPSILCVKRISKSCKSNPRKCLELKFWHRHCGLKHALCCFLSAPLTDHLNGMAMQRVWYLEVPWGQQDGKKVMVIRTNKLGYIGTQSLNILVGLVRRCNFLDINHLYIRLYHITSMSDKTASHFLKGEH